MKATFFSLAALAAGAIASPLANGPVAGQLGSDLTARDGPAAGSALDLVDDASASGIKATRGAEPTKEVSSAADLVSTIKATVSDITPHIDDVKAIVSKVKAGAMAKDAGVAEVNEQFSIIHARLSGLAGQLKSTDRLPVTRTFIGEALTLLITLFNELVAAAEAVIGAFGGIPALSSILLAVFDVVAEILAVVSSIAVGLVPGLVSVLSSIIAGLGTGILSTLVAPVTGVLSTLTAAAHQ